MRASSSLLCSPVLAALLVPLVVLCSACGDAGGGAASAAESSSAVAAVQAAPTGSPSSGTLRLAGVVESAEPVRIRSQVDGTVARVAALEGAEVQAGDLLLVLENPELVHLVGQAEAILADARARAEEVGAEAEMSAVQRAASLRDSEIDYESSVVGAEISRYEGVRILENDQAKNMAFSLTDIARSKSNLDRALNRQRQSELRRAASQARGASIAINLTKTARARQRMEELESKNYVSTSAVEEAQLTHATAVTRSEEHKHDLASRDEDVKAAGDEIASAQRRLDIWEEAFGHGVKSLEGARKAREAIDTRSESFVQRADVRREANRASVDLDAEKGAHTVDAAIAAVQTAEAALRAAEQRVAWLRIVAPSHGTVGRLNVAAGELVRSGKTTVDPGPPLLTLSNGARLVARARVDVSRLGSVVLGSSVRVTPSGATGKTVSGEVVAVVQSEGDGSTYIATIALPDGDDTMRLGSVVEIDFP